MIVVTLSPEETARCREIAQQRIALAKGNPRFAYRERNGFDTHTVGCFGELAAAKAIGTVWPERVGTYREKPDLDPFWEVRWSSNERRLKVALDDPPHYLVCHVTGNEPTFEVHGYILAGWVQRNIKAEDIGNEGNFAYFLNPRFQPIVPIDEGFHSICAWGKFEGRWLCFYCGKPYEGPTP